MNESGDRAKRQESPRWSLSYRYDDDGNAIKFRSHGERLQREDVLTLELPQDSDTVYKIPTDTFAEFVMTHEECEAFVIKDSASGYPSYLTLSGWLEVDETGFED